VRERIVRSEREKLEVKEERVSKRKEQESRRVSKREFSA